MKRGVVLFLATGAGVGYTPLAPGTAGSLIGVAAGRWGFAPLWQGSAAGCLMLFTVLFIFGCWIAGAAEPYLNEHDSSHIVIDEVFGMAAAMFLNPVTWTNVIAAFVLFRMFDVIKPWPASRFDRMPGGGGVMLDDLAAGIYANLALQVLRRAL